MDDFDIDALPKLCYAWRKLDLKVALNKAIAERCSQTLSRVGSQLYLIGGGKIRDPIIGFEHCSDVWRLDVTAGKAEEVQAVGSFTPRRGHSAVVYQDRYIIVFGGIAGEVSENPSDITQGMTNDLYIFDTVTNTWSEPPATPTNRQRDEEGRAGSDPLNIWPSPRRGHAAAVYGNKMYIVGGDCHDMNDIFRVYTLDLQSWRWQSHQVFGTAPLGLSLSSYEQVEDVLVFFSGTTLNMSARDHILSQVRVLNLETYEWRDLSHVLDWAAYNPRASRGSIHRQPAARFCSSSALLFGGKAMVVFGGTKIGGTTTDRAYVNDLLVFNPTSLLSGGAESTKAYDLNKYTDSPAKKLKYFAHRCQHDRRRQDADATGIMNDAGENIEVNPSSATVVGGGGGGNLGGCRPEERNGMAMVAYGNSVVMFGGGIYPASYFSDVWVLDFFVLPKVPRPFRSTPTRESQSIDATSSSKRTPRQRHNPADSEEFAHSSMFHYFATLLGDRRFADVAFIVDKDASTLLTHTLDRMLPASTSASSSFDTVTQDSAVVLAHRSILCARCVYFRTMFDGSFAESSAGIPFATTDGSSSKSTSGTQNSSDPSSLPDGLIKVRLEGVNATAFQHLLHFLYCNELPPRAFDSADSIWDLVRNERNDVGVANVLSYMYTNSILALW